MKVTLKKTLQIIIQNHAGGDNISPVDFHTPRQGRRERTYLYSFSQGSKHFRDFELELG